MTRPRDTLNAFLDLPQVAVPHAQSGPLAGLSLAVKDIFDVAGFSTGCGNPQRLREAAPATRTAPAVQSLLDAGARFVGKTQTDELAFSLIGQNAHYPQPLNPAAPDRVTGGSSSGSAAAVAGGLADIATGSDTGGSIRAPAGFCGLVGLRTTHGRISLEGAMPLAPSLDVFGWFARDIDIYARVGALLLGEDAKPFALNRLLSARALEDLLIGPDEADAYRMMKQIVIEALGEASPLPAPNFQVDELYWMFRRIQAYEAWAVHGEWIAQQDRQLGPGVKERFEFGRSIGCETAAAETSRRNRWRIEFADMLGNDGVLILPTVPGAAPPRTDRFENLQAYRERALRLLCLSGLSGFPQLQLPLGKVHGAPFGLSLIGPAGSDRALIELGRRILQR